MSKKNIAILLAVLAYLIAGVFVAAYLAGILYYLVNKTLPEHVGFETWMQYWAAYSADHVQRKRLQLSAGVAFFIVYLVPAMIAASLAKGGRSLHGDARFASAVEIRKSGLL
jgi:type IV secretion system protein VirD4